MPYTNHPAIETPSDSTKVWRYIDIDRLLALLCNRGLHLTRIDKFRDPWEGSWPKSLLDAVPSLMPTFARDSFVDASEKMKKSHFVSCWHENHAESAALWDLYAQRSGVAIQSSIGSLKKAIGDNKDYFVGRVEYLDFDFSPPPDLNFLIPPFLKRKSFEHEKEVRVLYWEVPKEEDWGVTHDSHSLEADPNVLIEALYISPSAPVWLLPAVQGLLERFDIHAQVLRSSLYDPRIY